VAVDNLPLSIMKLLAQLLRMLTAAVGFEPLSTTQLGFSSVFETFQECGHFRRIYFVENSTVPLNSNVNLANRK